MGMFDDLVLYTGVIGGISVGAEVIAIALKNRKHKIGPLATSSFAHINDLRGLLGEGIRISNGIQLSKKASMEHICGIGATGSHKTTSLFYPNLLCNDITGSIIVSDPKGELYRDTANYQKFIGRTPILFSPLSPLYSFKYNPLEQCVNITQVIELAQTLLFNGAKALEIQTGVKAGGIEWLQMALPLLVSSLLYVKAKPRPFNTITNAVRLLINHSTDKLETLFTNADVEVQEQFNIFKTSLESPRTAASIKTTLASQLQMFLDSNIVESTKYTEFTVKQLRENSICLYISYPEIKSAYLSPLMAVFYSQLISQLMELQGKPIYFLFDEFANVGMINNFSSIVATARSREISFLICLQSISQLEQLYGTDNTKSILNNLKTKCFLPGISDTQTLNYISELVGDTEIQIKSTSISGQRTTTSYSTQRKRLMSSDEIRRLKEDEILIVAHNKQPVKDKQNLYYKYDSYLKRVSKCSLQLRG